MITIDSFSKILRTFTLAILSVTGCSMVLAQTNADKQYVQDLKSKLDVLMQDADGYYKSTVKPLENKQIQEIDREDHSAKQKQLQALYDKEANYNTIIDKCNKDLGNKNGQLSQKKGASLDEKVETFVIGLLNSRYNPNALDVIKDCKDFVSFEKWEDIHKLIKRLNNYSDYCNEMNKVLKDFKNDFKVAQWQKIDDESETLTQFDQQLKRIGYLDRYKKRENIPFLDKCYDRILDMRNKGFANCQAEYEKLMNDLTPDNSQIKSPIDDIKKLENDINALEQQRGATQRELDAIKPEIKRLEDILSNNLRINKENKSISNDRKQVNETWSAKKDAIDKVLYDACLYCLDQKHPCDTLGNNEWLRKEVEKLTDAKSKYPQSEDYKKLFSQFNELFNNYEAYTLEIGEFLQNCYKYNKGNGELTNAMRNEINAELKNLKYWKYYSNRNGKNAVHSRNLDYILGEFEAMFNTNFKNCKARYRKLGPMLRGVE